VGDLVGSLGVITAIALSLRYLGLGLVAFFEEGKFGRAVAMGLFVGFALLMSVRIAPEANPIVALQSMIRPEAIVTVTSPLYGTPRFAAATGTVYVIVAVVAAGLSYLGMYRAKRLLGEAA
jgi:hypothetical protein